jgi:hypothetical protein
MNPASATRSTLTRLVQDAGVGHVAEDDGDLGRDLAGGTGVGDGRGVGTLAGTKEAEPENFAGTHVSYIAQFGQMRKMEKGGYQAGITPAASPEGICRWIRLIYEQLVINIHLPPTNRNPYNADNSPDAYSDPGS